MLCHQLLGLQEFWVMDEVKGQDKSESNRLVGQINLQEDRNCKWAKRSYTEDFQIKKFTCMLKKINNEMKKTNVQPTCCLEMYILKSGNSR